MERKWEVLPDARDREIQRLHERVNGAADGLRERDAENKQLRELLTAYTERYRCRCRHHWCKRCELDRKAAELLAATEGK